MRRFLIADEPIRVIMGDPSALRATISQSVALRVPTLVASADEPIRPWESPDRTLRRKQLLRKGLWGTGKSRLEASATKKGVLSRLEK
jgi:hypothetical protein